GAGPPVWISGRPARGRRQGVGMERGRGSAAREAGRRLQSGAHGTRGTHLHAGEACLQQVSPCSKLRREPRGFAREDSATEEAAGDHGGERGGGGDSPGEATASVSATCGRGALAKHVGGAARRTQDG